MVISEIKSLRKRKMLRRRKAYILDHGLSKIAWVINVISETHILAMLPSFKANSYSSGRKNEYIQNVMTLCSFDMHLLGSGLDERVNA